MRIPIFQVDAFTGHIFGGNPAAVCPLDAWLPDETLLRIAAENNLSETAFLVARNGEYDLRWFTPLVEVDLCGHATLGSAWVVLNRLAPDRDRVVFETKSGALTVKRNGESYEMDFPSQPGTPCDPTDGLVSAMGGSPREVHRSIHYYLVAYETEAEVRALSPNEKGLLDADLLGVIATAPASPPPFPSSFWFQKAAGCGAGSGSRAQICVQG